MIPVPGADAGPEGTAPQFVARPGGNALNVAVAAGRLGAPVRLLARPGRGPLAANLRRHAELSGVDPGGFVDAAEPVSLAVVGLGEDGSPDYGFHVVGAADWQWTDAELGDVLPGETAILHVGSISSWTAPGSEAIARLVERVSAAGSALISVDPNIRPMLADGPVGETLGNTAPVVRARLDRLVARADVVKVSAEDLAWLQPGLAGAAALGRTGPGTGPADRRRRAAADRPAGPPGAALDDPPGDRRGHGRRRRLPRRGTAQRPAAGRDRHPRGAGGAARRDAAGAGRRGRAGGGAQLHPGRRRPAHPRRAGRRASLPVTDPDPADVAIVGLSELSATVIRARLLDAHDRFWDTDTRTLHDPVWFNQFGGFGAVATTPGGEDVGYVLGVVTADRLAYLHLLTVREDRRRAGQ